MKTIKYLPFFLILLFFGCNSEKESIQPEFTKSNSRITTSSNSFCEIPQSTPIGEIASVLSSYINCSTPVCENYTLLPVNHIFTLYTNEFAPYNYNPSEIVNYADQIQDEANNYLVQLQNGSTTCNSIIISSYSITYAQIPATGYKAGLKVIVYFACCDGGGGGDN